MPAGPMRGLRAALLAGLLLAGVPALMLHESESHQADSQKRMEEAARLLESRIDRADDALKAAGGINAWEIYQALRSAGTMESLDSLQKEGSVQTLDEDPNTGVWKISKHNNLTQQNGGKEGGVTFAMPTGAPYKRNPHIQVMAGDLRGDAYDRMTEGLLGSEIAMLDVSQRKLLEKIREGKVSKNEIEIVVSHFDEDVQWMDMYSSLVTAYCKGEIYSRYPLRPTGCNQLPNVGRESHTFLHHIVQNYDKLADWTVFTQAQAPTSGWSGTQGDRRNGHIYPGATFHDYVLGGGPFAGENGDRNGSRFVFNGRWRPPQVGTAVWDKIHMAFAPHFYSDVAGGADKRITTPCLDLEGYQTDLDLGGPEVMLSLNGFLDFLGEDRGTKFYAQGARFALSRERILQRPKEFYSTLRDIVNREVFPISSVFVEFLWYYIPGSPNKEMPCQQDLRVGCPQGFDQLGSLHDDTPNGRLRTSRPLSVESCAEKCVSESACGAFMHNAAKGQTCVFLSSNASSTREQIGFWPGTVTCKKKA